MIKKFLIFFIMILLIIGLSGKVLAKDKYTATSNINGVIVNWEYELNDSNRIENLKCTNPTELTGNITIPNTLDGKTVISIGSEAFKSATNITGVTVSDSIKTIGYSAFKNCTKLNRIDLANVTTLSFDIFENCTSLMEVTIPKTLKNGSTTPSLNNSSIKNINFEDGLTTIPTCLCANTGITEITIPDSVKEIGYNAFKNCTSLEKINLGKIEKIGFDAFMDCSKLKSVTIPKTLIDGPGEVNDGVFTGTTSITSITFEDGTKVIASGILKDCKGIKNVIIPNTVTKVSQLAFENSGITELTFSNSLKEIEYNAFKDCFDLKKITILDNCERIGWFTTSPNQDTVFKNHNEDLTIYCYEGSKIAEYAIATNIKYVYLTKPADSSINENADTQKEIEQQQTPITSGKTITKTDDTTTAKGVLPQTGSAMKALFVILIITIVSAIFFIKYKKFKDI